MKQLTTKCNRAAIILQKRLFLLIKIDSTTVTQNRSTNVTQNRSAIVTKIGSKRVNQNRC